MRDGGKECQVVSSDVSLARRHIAAWRSKKEAAPIEVIPIVSHGNFIYNRILSPELKKQGFMNNIETVDFTQGGVAKRSFVPIDYRRLGFHAPSAQQLTRLCTSCKSQLFCGCGHHSDATPRRTLRRPFVSAPSAEAAPSPTPTSTIKGYDDDDDGDDSDENKEKRVVIPPARTSPPVCPKHNGSSPGKDQKIELPGNNVNAISTGHYTWSFLHLFSFNANFNQENKHVLEAFKTIIVHWFENYPCETCRNHLNKNVKFKKWWFSNLQKAETGPQLPEFLVVLHNQVNLQIAKAHNKETHGDDGLLSKPFVPVCYQKFKMDEAAHAWVWVGGAPHAQ